MGKLKITLIRSLASTRLPQKRTARALGLGKLHHSRIHPDNPGVRGMANAIRDWVLVESLPA